jgi:hypothetical protein
MKLTGYFIDPMARDTVMSPPSRGWRITSRTLRLNSAIHREKGPNGAQSAPYAIKHLRKLKDS